MVEMNLYWVDPQHKQARVCRRFAREHGFLLPEDCLYLVCVGKDRMIMGLSALNDDREDPCILYMYVPEQFRGKGVGSRMMKEIIESSTKAGFSSLRCFTEPSMEADRFLEMQGFDLFPGMTVYRTTFGALRYSRQYLKNIDGKSPGKACTVSSLGKKEQGILKDFFARTGLAWNTGYDTRISAADINGDSVDALVLTDRLSYGVIFKYLYAGADKAPSLIRCFRLLSQMKVNGEAIPPDYPISFALEGEKNYRLIRCLVGDDMQLSESMGTAIAVKLL